MRVEEVLVSETTYEKILEHGLDFEDVESVFYNDPLITKTRQGRYMAIGLNDSSSWVTIIFEYSKKQALIVTAYPSSDWQIKLYKRKKKR